MRQYERNGVIVDQCTDCRGIFLDRGELERLIDAEQAWHRPPAQARWDHDSGEYPRYGGYVRHRKRRSFLEELFD